VSVNRTKAAEERVVNASDLLQDRFLLLQRGKKSYFLVKVV
jgi:tyrosyl-tRNA synthetase